MSEGVVRDSPAVREPASVGDLPEMTSVLAVASVLALPEASSVSLDDDDDVEESLSVRFLRKNLPKKEDDPA
jgi:hypothetical protein